MSHPLDGATLRVHRADRHLAEADTLLDSFGDACIEHILTDDDGQMLKLDGWPDIPDMLPLVLSDAIHNMRAALDYIVYELARYDLRQIQHGTQFPIENHKIDPTNPKRGFDTRINTYLKGLHPDHIDAIESLQPYKGIEWTKTLRDISNPDKHRHLAILSSFQRSVQIAVKPHASGRFGPKPHVPVPGVRYNVEIDARDAVAIAPANPNEPGIMKTLRRLEMEVSATIEAFKPEFKI
jgi:hypothetical protein